MMKVVALSAWARAPRAPQTGAGAARAPLASAAIHGADSPSAAARFTSVRREIVPAAYASLIHFSSSVTDMPSSPPLREKRSDETGPDTVLSVAGTRSIARPTHPTHGESATRGTSFGSSPGIRPDGPQ